MLLFGPIGTSISSSQFRLKYPNTRVNDPSAFCSQPSYAGEIFSPDGTTWALVRESPARATASRTATTPNATASGCESLVAAFTMFELLRPPDGIRERNHTRQIAGSWLRTPPACDLPIARS